MAEPDAVANPKTVNRTAHLDDFASAVTAQNGRQGAWPEEPVAPNLGIDRIDPRSAQSNLDVRWFSQRRLRDIVEFQPLGGAGPGHQDGFHECFPRMSGLRAPSDLSPGAVRLKND